MESNALTAIFLPVSQFIIMLWMGVNLTPEDFKRLRSQPRATIVGLLAQILLLPALGLGVAKLAGLPPELAMGLVIISVCPGGPMSNLLSLLAAGDIALSVTLTALSSIITVFTIPLLINGTMEILMGQSATVYLPFLESIIRIALITLLPVAIGMVLKQVADQAMQKAENFLQWFCLSIVFMVCAGVLVKEWNNFPTYLEQAGLATIAFNLLAMMLGLSLSRLANLGRAQATAITVEVGIQNTVLAITIAVSPAFLNSTTMAIPGIIYAVCMLVTGSIFGTWCGRQAEQAERQALAAIAPNGQTQREKDKVLF